MSNGKEYVLDRTDTDVLYKKLESKDNLINELQSEIESMQSAGFGLEPANDDSNVIVRLQEELSLKNEEVSEISEKLRLVENESFAKSEELNEKRSRIKELESEIESLKEEKSSLDSSVEIKEMEEGLKVLKEKESALTKQLSEKEDIIAEQKEAIVQHQKVIEHKTEIIREKVAQLETMELEFGETKKLKDALKLEQEKNAELQEIQEELEESLNDYEKRLGSSSESVKEEDTQSVNLGDIFPVITDNTVLNARKICYIREIGENPWLEDLVCYLSAMLKSSLQDTQIEPYFVILDDLSSDIRRMKYKDYDFTLDALPAFGGAPESNVTVTSINNIPDLKAHLNISNQEFLIFIDRYGKSKPFVKRRITSEYNLVNNSELARLCKLPLDDSLLATFSAQKLVNSCELPTDYSTRGKRDRISLFLSKKAYSNLLDSLQAGLFK